MMSVKGDSVTAVDLSKVVMINSTQKEQKNVLSSSDLAYQEARRQRKVRLNSTQKEQKNVLSSSDLAYQEARRQRKVRRLDFDVR
jgi:hypothetical protein